MTVLLTEKTPIPTPHRLVVRAVLKAKPGFKDWTMGLWESRNVPNKVLLMFALDNGYAEEVEDILTDPHIGRRYFNMGKQL